MGASHRQQQHRIGSDLERGNRFHGIGIAHLRLAYAQQSLLLTEVDFDVPAPHVALEQRNDIDLRIGANQKGGFPVKKLGAFAEPISQRGNHHQLQSVLQAGRTPQQGAADFDFHRMSGVGKGNGNLLPGDGFTGTNLFGGGNSGAVVTRSAALVGVACGRRQGIQFGVVADAANEDRVDREGLQNRGVGVPAISKDVEWASRAGSIAIDGLAESDDLLGAAPGKASLTAGGAIGGLFFGGSFSRRPDGRGCGDKRDRHHAMLSVGKGDIGRELQDALSPHEVGLKVRAKRIATPAHARDADAGLAEKRVIDGHTKGSLRGELLQHGATNDGEDLIDGEASLREEPVIGRPIVELLSSGGEQARHGVPSEAEQTAQRQGLCAFGDALLGEGGDAFSPELLDGGEDASRVFFRTEGGG